MDPTTKQLIARLKVPFFCFALGVMASTLTACNTVGGAGEDIEAAGDAIDDAAEDASD